MIISINLFFIRHVFIACLLCDGHYTLVNKREKVLILNRNNKST